MQCSWPSLPRASPALKLWEQGVGVKSVPSSVLFGKCQTGMTVGLGHKHKPQATSLLIITVHDTLMWPVLHYPERMRGEIWSVAIKTSSKGCLANSVSIAPVVCPICPRCNWFTMIVASHLNRLMSLRLTDLKLQCDGVTSVKCLSRACFIRPFYLIGPPSKRGRCWATSTPSRDPGAWGRSSKLKVVILSSWTEKITESTWPYFLEGNF